MSTIPDPREPLPRVRAAQEGAEAGRRRWDRRRARVEAGCAVRSWLHLWGREARIWLGWNPGVRYGLLLGVGMLLGAAEVEMLRRLRRG